MSKDSYIIPKIPPDTRIISADLRELRFYDLENITLKSFSCNSIGMISDSVEGFRYRRYKNSGTLTSVTRKGTYSKYSETILVDTKIENPEEFQKNIFEILLLNVKIEDVVCDLYFDIKLRLYDKLNDIYIEITDFINDNASEERLTTFLNDFYKDYVGL